jgi:hypothetical protein
MAHVGLRPDHILPCIEGGVRFAFRRQGRYADIEFLNNGEVVATCSAPAGEIAGEAPRYWLVSPGGAGFASTFDTIQAFLGA